MESVVNQHPVKQDLVLNGRATADVQLATLVAGRDEARKDLQGLNQIGGTTKTWDALDVCWSNGLDRGADLGGLFLAVGPYFCATERNDHGLQQDVSRQHLVVFDLDRLFDSFVFQGGHYQGVVARRDPAKAVVPFHVRAHAKRCPLQGY